MDKGCASTGCNGTGFIIVGVIGLVVLIVIVLVVIAVMKRVHNTRRQKRFQNVDYLINGMYS